MSSPKPRFPNSSQPGFVRSNVLRPGRGVRHCEGLLQSRCKTHYQPCFDEQDSSPRLPVSHTANARRAASNRKHHERREKNSLDTCDKGNNSPRTEKIAHARPTYGTRPDFQPRQSIATMSE